MRTALLHPAALFFVVLWLALMAAGRTAMLNDPGTLWHVRVGNILLEQGRITSDPFSCTFGGQPWVPHQWGGEVLMAATHNALGWDGLLSATAAVLAGTFAYLGGRLVAGGLHWLPTAALLALAVAASSANFVVRPHVITIAGMAATVVTLANYDQGRCGRWHLLGLVAWFAVWANLHGGVLGGIATLGLVVSLWLIQGHFQWGGPVRTRRDAAWHIGLVLVAMGIVLWTPYGWAMLGEWRLILTSGGLPKYVLEHRSPVFTEPAGFGLVGMIWVLGAAGWNRGRTEAPACAALAWCLLGIQRVRHVPLGVVSILAVLPDAMRVTPWLNRYAERGGDLYQPTDSPAVPWGAALLPALLVGVSVALQAAGVAVPVVGAGWARPHPDVDPVEVLPVLRELERQHPGAAVFNDYNLGGFVIFRTPGLQPFIDDRFELYGDTFSVNFLTAHEAQVRDWLASFGCRAALLIPESRHDKTLRSLPGWREAARCATAVVYLRDER